LTFKPKSTRELLPDGPGRAGQARSRPRMARFSASVIATALISLGAGAGTGWPGTVPPAGAAVLTHGSSAVDSDFATLVADIAGSPAESLGGPARKELIFERAVLAHRRIDAQPANPCAIVPTLARLRTNLATTTVTNGNNPTLGTLVASPLVAAQLEADILDIQSLLLSSGDAVRCGGAGTPSTPAGFPLSKVTSSDNTEVTFDISFPAPRFSETLGDGAPYTQILSPGMGDVSSMFSAGNADSQQPGATAVGLPQLPVTGEEIALPQGASASVLVLHTSSYLLPAVQAWPLQPGTEAASTSSTGAPLPPPAPPFTIDRTGYSSSAAYPSQLAVTSPTGSGHGLAVASVALAGAQYRPAQRLLRVLTGMEVRVSFGGNSQNVFGTDQLMTPDDLPFLTVWQSSLLNYNTIGQYLGPYRGPNEVCGEEMMMITSPALTAVASTFAAERTSDGILTRVFATGPTLAGGIGTTPEQIRNFITNQYDNPDCRPHPSYVLLLGDTTVVPTFEISFGTTTSDGTVTPNFPEEVVATDMPYGFIHQASQVDASLAAGVDKITDYNPDLFVGRVPVPDVGGQPSASAASAELTTIHNYEDNPPPAGSAFYQNVVGAEFFQPCPDIQDDCGRTANPPYSYTPTGQDEESFLRSSEFVGTEAAVAGKTFERVATDEANNDPGVIINPKTFDTGAPLPPGINFNGNGTDISNDLNTGAFLLWHSDHGYTNGSGWYEPGYGEGDISSLSEPANNELPVVWSSDCDSGKFDSNSESSPYVTPGIVPGYSEFWLEDGKAVGTVGSSRISYIYQDGFLLQGMGTSLFPEEGNIFRVLLGGSPVASVLQLGQLVAAAKSYMETETAANMTSDDGPRGSALEYNAFGDPSMAIWRNAPSKFVNPGFHGSLVDANTVQLTTSQTGLQDTLVSLTHDGTYIGQGILTNGSTVIRTDVSLQSLSGIVALLNHDDFQPGALTLGPGAPVSTLG
jgi:Peptidase family C25/Propeptide_C25